MSLLAKATRSVSARFIDVIRNHVDILVGSQSTSWTYAVTYVGAIVPDLCRGSDLCYSSRSSHNLNSCHNMTAVAPSLSCSITMRI
jgi:hypothetical protein